MPYSNQLFNFISELAQSNQKRQIQFMKVENTIFRRKCPYKHMHLDEKDKELLLKYGLPLGGQVKHLISIVHYSTFRNWVVQNQNPVKIRQKRGRPRVITTKIRELIVHMARHNKWGYTKILGELKKLSIKRLSRSSVKNVLREYGINPLKIRSQDTWDNFLKRTFDTLLACDFFCKSVWTPFGRRVLYVLFFINIHTRQVYVTSVTRSPDKEWVLEQIKKLEPIFNTTRGKAVLIRDRDIKYPPELDAFLLKKGTRTMKIPPHSPNMNPYAESWVATIKRECLDHFLVFGAVHLESLVNQYVDYYNNYRPHSSMDNLPLDKNFKIKSEGEICVKPLLGGLINHYYRE